MVIKYDGFVKNQKMTFANVLKPETR